VPKAVVSKPLLDHLVGSDLQRERNSETERLCSWWPTQTSSAAGPRGPPIWCLSGFDLHRAASARVCRPWRFLNKSARRQQRVQS